MLYVNNKIKFIETQSFNVYFTFRPLMIISKNKDI
jgi:hypothetical protein